VKGTNLKQKQDTTSCLIFVFSHATMLLE